MDALPSECPAETRESLADSDVELAKLEQDPKDLEAVNVILRRVHSIKGTCGFFGLVRLENVAHGAENILAQIRGNLRTSLQ